VADVITLEEYDQEYAHIIGEGNDGTHLTLSPLSNTFHYYRYPVFI
jgi:hypothetical protein